MREIDKKAVPFLKNKGYGKGTNYTTDLVASLMLQFSKEQEQELPIHSVRLSLPTDSEIEVLADESYKEAIKKLSNIRRV